HTRFSRDWSSDVCSSDLKGHNTSVPFGFTNTLLEVIQKQKPTHIGVAFDTAAKTFRDDIYAEYKSTRQETPEDIRYGVPICKEIDRKSVVEGKQGDLGGE